MKSYNKMLAVILPGLFLLAQATNVFATEILKWIDQEGVTHYSEEPPLNEQQSTEQVELGEEFGVSPIEPEGDFYSIANQARRLEESRLAREESRRKDRQLDLQEQALEAQRTPVVVDTQQDNRYFPAFFRGNRFDRFHGRQGFHDRRGAPEHGSLGRGPLDHGQYDDDSRFGGRDRGRGRDDNRGAGQSRRSSPAFKASAIKRQ